MSAMSSKSRQCCKSSLRWCWPCGPKYIAAAALRRQSPTMHCNRSESTDKSISQREASALAVARKSDARCRRSVDDSTRACAAFSWSPNSVAMLRYSFNSVAISVDSLCITSTSAPRSSFCALRRANSVLRPGRRCDVAATAKTGKMTPAMTDKQRVSPNSERSAALIISPIFSTWSLVRASRSTAASLVWKSELLKVLRISSGVGCIETLNIKQASSKSASTEVRSKASTPAGQCNFSKFLSSV
mmetsp:Transcript_92882/g.298823  ORF Transcript_92882/g.298823 Transcript_92882/m.298823 type:complete len:245 (-) Transcript_92882:2427-3161(-)